MTQDETHHVSAAPGSPSATARRIEEHAVPRTTWQARVSMNEPAHLDPTAHAVLTALTGEYFTSGQRPIHPAELIEHYGEHFSLATVRGALRSLDAAGLTVRPGQCDGRAPSNEGLRIWVQAIADFREIALLAAPSELKHLCALDPEQRTVGRDVARAIVAQTTQAIEA